MSLSARPSVAGTLSHLQPGTPRIPKHHTFQLSTKVLNTPAKALGPVCPAASPGHTTQRPLGILRSQWLRQHLSLSNLTMIRPQRGSYLEEEGLARLWTSLSEATSLL